MGGYLGIDCGSVSLNLVLSRDGSGGEPVSVYRRTQGQPLHALIRGIEEIVSVCGGDLAIDSAVVTGSGREMLSELLVIPSINEISAHAAGVRLVNPQVMTIIEIGGQDSKFISIEPSSRGDVPRLQSFRMNEICAAGTGAFLDEQCERLGIAVESFGDLALRSKTPAPIAGRCAVFAKTDMIHRAQEGTPLPDILLGLAFALARNYMATLVRGELLKPLVSLQGGVMSNAAVVYAFRKLLDLEPDQIVIPPYFKVMGAFGCAALSRRNAGAFNKLSLADLIRVAKGGLTRISAASSFPPLDSSLNPPVQSMGAPVACSGLKRPLVMGLDVGSVSVKGVIIDAAARIIRQDYRLSRSRTLETVEEVLGSLSEDGLIPDAVAVTGSGRYLVGRLLGADLIINEITAQAAAAINCTPDEDTVVELGGQDSKWIALERGAVKEFEMNKVCAAGTGSFLMAQAQRLGLSMGSQFSQAAFSASAPADLGSRCTVFMESDLIHHQNNGASTEDLAAGVCISIVHNYLERVANNKTLGGKVLFLGGVAANPAVRAAFEQQTGRKFHTPEFFRVSGALGVALKALEKLHQENTSRPVRGAVTLDSSRTSRDEFTCNGCTNQCLIYKYRTTERVVFHGGLCDRWEVEEPSSRRPAARDPFELRVRLIEDLASGSDLPSHTAWGIARAPQFYEWFPFWHGFFQELGISLVPAGRPGRRQFESGLRHLRVETCLPMKTIAGQIQDLVNHGVRTVFHPSILSDPPATVGGKPLQYCPFIQGSSVFFKGAFDIALHELVVSHELDPDSFRRDHLRLAATLGYAKDRAERAFEQGMSRLESFRRRLRAEGDSFLASLEPDEQALVVLGKPYHTADRFLNMNLGSLCARLGVRALPSDLYPLGTVCEQTPVEWKYQIRMIRVANAIARDPRLFPVMITFFGCGPDPFTLRHIRGALRDKPLLVLEMDEHSSRAGIVTRLEAFLERIARQGRSKATDSVPVHATAATHASIGRRSNPRDQTIRKAVPESPPRNRQPSYDSLYGDRAQSGHGGIPNLQPHVRTLCRPEILYLPYMCEHAYAFAAAACSVGIEGRVLPPPDQESEALGRPHTVGGECHPYVLILGDYLKLAARQSPQSGPRSVFFTIGANACRLPQFPIYIDVIRRKLGLSMRVIGEVRQGLEVFGLSDRCRQKVLLRAWEGLNAYDTLLRLFLQIRPAAKDKAQVEQTFAECRDGIFRSLAANRVRQGVEEALHLLYECPLEDSAPRPVVAVTGDYYTRVVPFANNDVYREVETLGGTIWSPPTLSDSLKLGTLRDLVWRLLNHQSRAAASEAALYLLLAVGEFRVKGFRKVRGFVNAPLDLSGRQMWRAAALHAHTRLPAGITAPIATVMQQLDGGAAGVLNLMTLNCAFGTVVTASLLRALKERQGIPMLTLVYDGLKKTNEKTRLEAFMEQVWDRFQRSMH